MTTPVEVAIQTADSGQAVRGDSLVALFPPDAQTDLGAGAGNPVSQAVSDLLPAQAGQAEVDATPVVDDRKWMSAVKTLRLIMRNVYGFVRRRDLEGVETDRYASWQGMEEFLSDLDRRGLWSLGSNAAGAPGAADEVALSAVADGDYTLALPAVLRTDIDPDAALTWDAARGADAYPSGTVLHLVPWAPYDADAHARVTTTGAATLVGQGTNGAYLWMPVTIDEVGDLQDTNGYYRIALEAPSGLDVKLPSTAIVAPPWLRTDASNRPSDVPTPTLNQQTKLLLSSLRAATIEHLAQHFRPQTTGPTRVTATWETSSTDIDSGEMGFQNVLLNGIAQLFWKIPAAVPVAGSGDTLPRADIVQYFTAHHNVVVYTISTVLTAKVTYFFTQGGVHFINIAEAALTGPAFADGNTVTVELESNIPSRAQIADQAYQASATNVAGGGGAAGKVWKWISSASNAAWGLIGPDSLDAGTAAKKAALKAAQATGRLEKDIAGQGAVTLTAAEAAYDSLEFVGALTADRVVTLPAAPTGVLLVRNAATVHDVKLKASGQSDLAAVTLSAGDNVVLHRGGSLALFT